MKWQRINGGRDLRQKILNNFHYYSTITFLQRGKMKDFTDMDKNIIESLKNIFKCVFLIKKKLSKTF